MGKKKSKAQHQEAETDGEITDVGLTDMEDADDYHTEMEGQDYETEQESQYRTDYEGQVTDTDGQAYRTEYDAEDPEYSDDAEDDFERYKAEGNEQVMIPHYMGGNNSNVATYEVGDAEKTVPWHKGHGPLRLSIIFFNILEVVIGACTLTLGILVLGGNPINLTPYKYIEGIATRNDTVFGSVCVAIGFLTMCAGCGGIFLSRRISEGDLLGTSRRFFIAYQMWVILMVLIVLAVLGLTAYALGALNADPSSTELGWRNNVQLDPEVNCRVTLDPEYQCAGYYGNECNGGNSTATNTWCAGHFCAIYCRVKDPNGPNPSESCKICVEQQKTYGQFGSCFNREVEFTAKGCQESYNEEVRSMYTIALIFSVLASASQITLIVITSLRTCSCYRNDDDEY